MNPATGTTSPRPPKCKEKLHASIRTEPKSEKNEDSDNRPHREIEQYAQRLLALVKQHAPTQEEAFDLPPEMKPGLARCTYNEAMKDRLEEDKTYYISEISNMMGRVVILESGQLPMVGYHLYRFELDPAG